MHNLSVILALYIIDWRSSDAFECPATGFRNSIKYVLPWWWEKNKFLTNAFYNFFINFMLTILNVNIINFISCLLISNIIIQIRCTLSSIKKKWTIKEAWSSGQFSSFNYKIGQNILLHYQNISWEERSYNLLKSL